MSPSGNRTFSRDAVAEGRSMVCRQLSGLARVRLPELSVEAWLDPGWA